MPVKKSYADHGDACATAHGMEVIGEVWTYPILREMFLGPKRFGELLALVHGITPAVLTTRLKELRARGLVEQAALAPPARGSAYQLTAWGHALEPVMEHVARWAQASPTWRSEGDLTPDASILAMKTMAAGPRPASAATSSGADESIGDIAVQIELHDHRLEEPDTYTYAIDWTSHGLTAKRGAHEHPAVVIRTNSRTWTHALFQNAAIPTSAVTAGDEDVVKAFLARFRGAAQPELDAPTRAAPTTSA